MNHYEDGTDNMRKEEEGNKTDAILLQKDREEWEKCKRQCYRTKYIAQTDWGIISFDPDMMKDVVGGEKLTYDEYLEIMKASGNKTRQYFELCYYGGVLSNSKGQMEKKSKGMICFKRIYVSGIYSDGLGFEGREDHVWMKNKGFEQGEVGDCFSFSADVYRYLKTGNGKAIDFALRNPRDITQISDYELLSDDELHMQSIDRIICEVCMYNERCYNGICSASEKCAYSIWMCYVTLLYYHVLLFIISGNTTKKYW